MDDEDALLYGDGPSEDTVMPAENNEKILEENEPSEMHEQNPDADVSQQSQEYEVIDEEVGDDEDDSDDEDNVQVIINQDKIEEAKTTLVINKLPRPIPSETKKGKFNVEDFDKVGTIDGQPAQEIDLEAIDDKPWKKPGADITDYFNYGFTEDTWAAYCARQKRMRLQESGVGLPNNPNSNVPSSTPGQFSTRSHNGGTIPTLGQGQIKRLGPSSSDRHRDHNLPGSAEKTPSGIAVLTADKRDYSKKIIQNMDFSVPPPGMNVPPPTVPPGPPPNFSGPPPGADDFDPFAEDQYDNYAGGYEPTQESQWVAPPSTYLGGGDNPDAPPGDAAYEDKRDPWQRNGRRTSRESPGRDRRRRRSRSRSRDRYRERDRRDRDRGIDKERDRGIDKERERGVDKDRERDRRRDDRRDRDRDRERDRKRERSKSRSPRRDSRSPSSSDRHKHKKSKREKRERSESEKPDKSIKKEVKDEPEDYVE